MGETRKVLKLREHCTFEPGPDGAVRARFALLDASGEGANEDEAFRSLVEAIRLTIATSPPDKARFDEFAAANTVEEEVPEEEVRARRGTIEASHEASKGFRALTADDFDSAIAGSSPVLVDFWAEWCMPCHMVAPVLKEVADALAGRLEVMKLNVDDHGAVSDRFGIRGIPTMILFAGGRERHRLVGAGRSKEQFLDELEPHLG